MHVFEWFSNLSTASKVSMFGILLTFIVSIISLCFSIRNNKATHYANIVTEKRVEWVYHLRDLISKFVALTNIFHNTYYNLNTAEDIEKAGKHLSECMRINIEIKLLLNFSDNHDRCIMSLIDKILDTFSGYYYETFTCDVDDKGFFINTKKMDECEQEINRDIPELIKKVQIYLKSEWNRIKCESKGKVYEKNIQDFDYEELEKKYNDINYKSNKITRWGLILKTKIHNFFTRLLPFLICIIGILILVL